MADTKSRRLETEVVKVVPPFTVRSQSAKVPVKHQTLVSNSNQLDELGAFAIWI
jgi:hypothetical protein